jgi:hypothetical protein
MVDGSLTVHGIEQAEPYTALGRHVAARAIRPKATATVEKRIISAI